MLKIFGLEFRGIRKQVKKGCNCGGATRLEGIIDMRTQPLWPSNFCSLGDGEKDALNPKPPSPKPMEGFLSNSGGRGGGLGGYNEVT